MTETDFDHKIKALLKKIDFLELEKFLGVKEGFFQNLFEESSWSLIIKIGVILEATLERSIHAAFNEKFTLDFLSKLNMNGRSGKLALAEDIGLIDRELKKSIEKIFEIRNSFAHKLSCVDKTLYDYYQGVDDKGAMLNAILPFYSRDDKNNEADLKIEMSLELFLIVGFALILKKLSDITLQQKLMFLVEESTKITSQLKNNEIDQEKRAQIVNRGQELLKILEESPRSLIKASQITDDKNEPQKT